MECIHYLFTGILALGALGLFGVIIWLMDPRHPERAERMRDWFFNG